MKVINVAKEFSRFPSGRKINQGNTSGEAFRLKFLSPNIKNETPFIVELDGVLGYGSSFLEEAFGGLVRELQVSAEKILSLMTLRTSDKALELEIISYIKQAQRA